MDLNGKTALVTGASGDIGGAIARALAAEGADVAVGFLGHREGADATCEAVAGFGRRAVHVQLDQRDPSAIEDAIATVAKTFGRLDVLVNNAAWNIGIPFPDLTALTGEIWDRMLETNLRGPYLLSRAAAPLLAADDGGHIVNIASTGGLLPGSSSIAYSCSKAALIHLTRCLAVALAPDVAVNCVAPGLVEGTRMAQRLPEAVAESARSNAVLGRVGSPDDCANQVVAFCRSESISGQTAVVDGGMWAAMR
jgi:3-oxoacyl-[acyl-carrier protein] reductase